MITSSQENKYLWFRVAKAATTTILDHLSEHTKISFCNRINIYENKENVWQEYLMWKNRMYSNNYFKFAFIRNPWDRLVSCYFNKMAQNYENFNKNNFKTFDKFIYYISSIDTKVCDRHYRLQTELYPINKIDFVGRFENFSDDFGFVCDTIGISKHKQFKVMKKSKHRPYEQYYNKATQQIIKNKYEQDIELLEYKFGE